MNLKNSIYIFMVFLGADCLFGETLYWDANGVAAGCGNTGGDWNNDAYWSLSADGLGATDSWENLAGARNDVVFSAGTDGTGPFSVNVQVIRDTDAINSMKIEDMSTLTFTGQTSSRYITMAGDAEINVAAGSQLNLQVDIGGDAGFVKTGAGTLYKTSVDNHGGVIRVKDGTLEAGTDALSDSAAVVIDAGGTLSYAIGGGRPDTVGSIAGTGNLVLKGTTSPSRALTCGGDNTSTEFSGVISSADDDGFFEKTGTGTLTLSGNNTYRQETLVSGGTLLVNGVHTNENYSIGNYMVASGAALGGAGNIAASVSLTEGAVLSADNLTAQGLMMASGAAAESEYGEILTIAGDATLDGTWRLVGDWSALTASSISLYRIDGAVTDNGLTVDTSAVTGKNLSAWELDVSTGVLSKGGVVGLYIVH